MEFNREDIIWAAGLFEGEGCIRGDKRSYGIYPRVRIKMTDKDTVEKFARIFDLKVNKDKKYRAWKGHWKDPYYTEACGTKAYAILMMIFPWLGERRKQKAEQVIKEWCLNPR